MKCKQCGNEIPKSRGRRKQGGGKIPQYCSDKCAKHAYGIIYNNKNPHYHSDYYKSHIEEHSKSSKKCARNLKNIIIYHYGGKCKCCGETEMDFLTIDHINEDGAEHRRLLGRGKNFYMWLKYNNFPEGFQVLCFNCNWSKHLHNNTCIHQLKKEHI